MKELSFDRLNRCLRFIVATVLVAACIGMLLPGSAALAGYEDPPGGDPNYPLGGEWVETAHAASQQNACNAAAGEICKEWCWRSQNGTAEIASGDLCCVVGQDCRTPR